MMIVELDRTKILAILLITVTDVILVTLLALSFGPSWLVPNSEILIPYLNLIMSPLVVLTVVLVPTLFILHWAWPEKVGEESFLLPLRLALAYEFLHGGIEKLVDPTYLASPGLIGYGASAAPSPWIQGALTILLGNYEAFLLLIAVGELLIGLSMFFGAFTRLGAVGGVLMQWTFLILLGWLSISTFGINFVGSIAFFIIGMYQSGRIVGFDQILGPYLESSQNRILNYFGYLT
ncbi:MAG: DoxX family membrane protein [Candidatus Lokiarchaeota archaeon]|nr:DoxX family membrane protein [Candidatus Lokiarchaeota archaeon]